MKFRRQHPVGSYVLDFYCAELRLGIEVDGGQHAAPEEKERDRRRTSELEKMGVRVLRFWNVDVVENLEGVLERIFEETRPPSP